MRSRPAGKERLAEERAFVRRFGMQLLAVVGVGGALLHLAFYLLFIPPLPGTYAGVYFALRNLSAFLVPFLVLSVLAYVLAMSVVIALLSGYAFHKIAGPLYRMERALENYDSGEPIKAVFFRRDDQLIGLARAYNGFVARLREERGKWLAEMERAEQICLQDAATCRAEMEAALGRLSESLSRYR